MKVRAPADRLLRLAARLFVLILLDSALTATARAATVRGRLDRVDAYGRHYPAPNIPVTLYNARMGRSRPAYSQIDGMYYILNVPHDNYSLEIWWSPDPTVAPMVFNIIVNQDPFTDIVPIVVP